MIGPAARLIFRGVRDLGLHPWAQALTLAAVVLTAFLGGLFLLLLHNLDQELLRTRGQLAFQVYWRPRTDMSQVKEQWAGFDELPHLAEKITFTPEECLSELGKSLGAKNNMSRLKELGRDSPLPATALLYFSGLGQDVDAWAKDMLARLKELPGVESVHFNALQLELARSWIAFSHKAVWPLIGFLALVMALVVGNTIKLSMLGRKNEVEILRLVGAGRWYIQLPLLTGGAMQGLVGGGLAMAMLKGVQMGLKDLFASPPLMLKIRFLPLEQVLLVIGVITLVGFLSSWVAIRE